MLTKSASYYLLKIPSMKLTDIALTISSDAKHQDVGIRPGEKLHEQMIGSEDAPHTFEYSKYYKILPSINKWSQDLKRIDDGVKVSPDFTYRSDNNSDWMEIKTLQDWIAKNSSVIGVI